MGIFNFFLKKHSTNTNTQEFYSDDVSFHIEYNRGTLPKATLQVNKEDIEELELNIEYVELSTSGDENVCPMCAQFEGKIFPASNAPMLPLCPSCACNYLYYEKEFLPSGAVISDKSDFVLPAECTTMFYKTQQKAYEEAEPNKIIYQCEKQLKQLNEFMQPYVTANFPAPAELACRDLLPKLYMKLGKWFKAENTIKKCIDANAYFPQDGLEELTYLASYKKIATETLSYIQQHQGCLQRNIYKAMQYEGDKREQLKHFLRYSEQIRKVKHGNTNELYCD